METFNEGFARFSVQALENRPDQQWRRDVATEADEGHAMEWYAGQT
jgi:hypothetical protein